MYTRIAFPIELRLRVSRSLANHSFSTLHLKCTGILCTNRGLVGWPPAVWLLQMAWPIGEANIAFISFSEAIMVWVVK